jgi:hypothetical protein
MENVPYFPVVRFPAEGATRPETLRQMNGVA